MDNIIQQSIGGVMVSITAFQAVDLGSILGQCILFSSLLPYLGLNLYK